MKRVVIEVDAPDMAALAARVHQLAAYLRAGCIDHVDNGDGERTTTHEYHVYDID